MRLISGMRSLFRGFVAAALILLTPMWVSAGSYQLSLDSELGKRLANLPENSWVKLSANQFQDVWTPLDQRPKPANVPSVGGPWAVTGAWSSMAWDSNRGSLIFFGGGHANYPGNEVYRWNGNTLLWERGSLPSDVVRNTQSVFTTLYEAVDGPFAAPASAHTYDNSEFLPLSDRFVTFGGAAFNTGHFFELGTGERTGPYFWDPSRASPNAVGGTLGSQVKPDVYTTVTAGNMWQNRNNLQPAYVGEYKPGYGGTEWIDGTTAYAEENGKDVLYIAVSSQLFRYTVNDLSDPTKDTYELLGRYIVYPFTGQGAGAFDPYRRFYLRTAGVQFTYWTVDNPGLYNQNVIVTPTDASGTFPFSGLAMLGMDFDSVRRSFLLWGGQRNVWQLTAPTNLASGTWTVTPLSPASTAAPDIANIGFANVGILGKWKYARALDVFLGALPGNSGEIWAYKPANWSPTVVEALPFVVSPAAGSAFDVGANVPITVDSVDKTVSYVAVYVNGNAVGVGSAVPLTVTWTPSVAGAYAITARAIGADGIERTSTPVSVSVGTPTNVAPTVALTSPAAGQSFTQGSAIALAASASDSDGTVARVEFYADGVKLGQATSAPYSYSWSGATVGSHVLSAVAIDNGGASTTSATISISVSASVPNVAPTVALTSPTVGQGFTQGSAITLAANASDSDGTVTRVEFYADGVLLGQATSAPYSYSWSGATVGSHVLSAVAFDNAGASTTSATVSVSVTQVGSGGQSVTLQNGVNGYAGTTDAYVYQYFGSANYGAAQMLQDMAGGSYRFRSLVRFAIFQSEGGPVPDGATITKATLSLYKYSYYDTKYQLRPLLANWVQNEVTWNQARSGVAWAGAGATGLGTDAASSPDAIGDAPWAPGWLNFDATAGVQAMANGRANRGWVLDPLSGNGNLKYFYSSEYTGDTTLRPVLNVQYTIGGTNTPPTVSLSSPTAGQTFAQGSAITLTAAANDSDGAINRVEFYADGVLLGQATSAPYSYSWSGATVGSHVISAVAYDNAGASTTSAAVSITVATSVPNVAPTVALTSPAAGQSFTQGSAIALAASASDSDGTVARVEFYADGVKLGQATSAPYSYSWSGATVGSHVLSAVAIDNGGASTTSATISISVSASVPNVAPTVALTSPTVGQGFTQGSAITLAANASDSDGTVTRVEFYADGVLLGQATSAPYSYSWSGATVGSHVLSAVAFDNAGASTTSATVSVSVTQVGSGGQSVTLQNGVNGYAGTTDAYVYQYFGSANYGAAQMLQDMAGGSYRFRSLVRFAIFQSEGGPVPDGATITKATLSLYKYSYYDTKYQLRPLLANWVQNEVTWNQARSGVAWAGAGATGLGTDAATSPDAIGDTAWTPGWLNFDVTAGVQAMANGRANRGWVLDPLSGNGNLKYFYSSEYTGDTTLRPVLTIQTSQ